MFGDAGGLSSKFPVPLVIETSKELSTTTRTQKTPHPPVLESKGDNNRGYSPKSHHTFHHPSDSSCDDPQSLSNSTSTLFTSSIPSAAQAVLTLEPPSVAAIASTISTHTLSFPSESGSYSSPYMDVFLSHSSTQSPPILGAPSSPDLHSTRQVDPTNKPPLQQSTVHTASTLENNSGIVRPAHPGRETSDVAHPTTQTHEQTPLTNQAPFGSTQSGSLDRNPNLNQIYPYAIHSRPLPPPPNRPFPLERQPSNPPTAKRQSQSDQQMSAVTPSKIQLPTSIFTPSFPHRLLPPLSHPLRRSAE